MKIWDFNGKGEEKDRLANNCIYNLKDWVYNYIGEIYTILPIHIYFQFKQENLKGLKWLFFRPLDIHEGLVLIFLLNMLSSIEKQRERERD